MIEEKDEIKLEKSVNKNVNGILKVNEEEKLKDER